ncbi:MAG: hypothetical protein NVS2B17_33670 [Candidatus Velthaea sp.]
MTAIAATISNDPFIERDLARVAEFRAEYRSRFDGKPYFGPAHAAIIAAMGATALAAFIKGMRKPVKPAELAVVPVAFIACNLVEWAMHNYVMHVPRKGPLGAAMNIYTRHTLNHHQFFSRERMTYDNVNDYRIVFFPPFALMTLIGLSAGPAALLAKLFKSRNVGLLLMATTTGVYMVYETFHYTCHLKDNAFLRNMPFVNTIRRHHAAHHDKRVMVERNMNLTFPIADWLFGTSDLNRGLLGHIFNGYDETYVKPEFTVEGLRQQRTAGSDARAAGETSLSNRSLQSR